jgi:hypothetical protein
MTKKIIKYKLTEEGTIPSFIQEGGMFPSSLNSENVELIGISLDDVELPNDVVVYETQESLVNYLNSLPYDIVETPLTIAERVEYLFSLSTRE